ncbi:hypothetical protein, partial [Kitasatospora sp. NPDC047058]|uniref:hypothetical protein n=1 Tax=Kitasatospora sp. NPDC047058 TaxID=3155620 RepID=UPI003411F246
ADIEAVVAQFADLLARPETHRRFPLRARRRFPSSFSSCGPGTLVLWSQIAIFGQYFPCHSAHRAFGWKATA